MLGWVAIVIIILSAIAIWRFFFDGWEDGFIGSFLMWLFCTALVVFGVALAFAGVSYLFAHELKETKEHRYELRALDSDSNITGRSYFLGGGYIGEERVLNYIIRNEDGSSELGHTEADESKIWEDEQDKPYVIQIEKGYGNWWFMGDESYRTTYEYHYHIPAGSVLESTQITNK